MNEKTLYNAFAGISDTLTDAAYDAKIPPRKRTAKKAVAAILSLALVIGALTAAVLFAGGIINKPMTNNESAPAAESDGIIYRSENGDVTVRKIEPLEKPSLIVFKWKAMDDITFKKDVTTVFTGTVTDVTEISMSYTFMDQDVVDYWSLLTVNVNDMIKGDVSEGENVTVLFELSSHRYNRGITIEKDKEYVFYLMKTSEIDNILDYTPIADYIYHVPGPCFVPISEPQVPELLAVIGAKEETCGEEFVEALREYYYE